MLGRVAPTILLLWQVLERPLVNQMHFRFGSDNIRGLLAEEAYKFLSLAVYWFETFICAERTTAIGSLQLGQESKSV
jgi:hypothetical protein